MIHDCDDNHNSPMLLDFNHMIPSSYKSLVDMIHWLRVLC